MSSVGEEILVELKRNRELLDAYKEIGPVGTFRHMMITKDIEDAERALAENDVIKIIQSYEKLKGNK